MEKWHIKVYIINIMLIKGGPLYATYSNTTFSWKHQNDYFLTLVTEHILKELRNRELYKKK